MCWGKAIVYKFLHDGGLGLYCGLGGEGCRVGAGLGMSFPEC